MDLNSGRQSNGFSLNPISHLETQAYFQMRGERASTWELGVIRALDGVVLEQAAEVSRDSQRKNKRGHK